MESEPKIITDQECNYSSENNSFLPKLRHIPRRSAGSTVGFAGTFATPLLSPSTTTTTVARLATKSTVVNKGSVTCSVVTSMTMSRRRQSVQCPISLEEQHPLTGGGRRSRSLSTCTTSSSCSAIHSRFIHCSTTELRPQRFSRAPSTAADPLALDVAYSNDATVSPETPVSRDLQLNIVLGYNRTIRRKVANVKHPELLEGVDTLPMTKWKNNGIDENDSMHDTVDETQNPTSSSTKRAIKPKPRSRKIKPKEIKPKVEKTKATTTKAGLPRKINLKKSVKVETTTSSTQTQIEDIDTEIPTNVCQPKNQPSIMVDGHLIEMKDELCFLTQRQLQPSDDASLTEMKSLLSFLTPQQVHCLHSIHKVKRKEDLMYLNLWQLHKIGIHHPEIVLSLMQVALGVNLHQNQEDHHTISDTNCPSDDVNHGVDDHDDCEDPQLVIDVPPNNETYENDEVPSTNDIQLTGTHEQIDKTLVPKTQTNMGNEFKELLTEVNETANTVHDKLLIIKNQNLSPKDKYQKLWPLFELLKRQEKRVETLWKTLLHASGKVSENEEVVPSTEPPVTPCDEDCQQNVNDEVLCILLPETEENKNNGTIDDEFLPSDILECSLGHDGGNSPLEIPTTTVEILENENVPPLAANEIVTTHDDEEDNIPKILESESCSSTSSVYGEETKNAMKLDNKKVVPNISMDIEKTEAIDFFTNSEKVHQDSVLYSVRTMSPTESTVSQEEVDNQEANQYEEAKIVQLDAPSSTIILSPSIVSEEISFFQEDAKSVDIKQHTEHKSNNEQSSDLDLSLNRAEKQNIQNTFVEKLNVNCNGEEELLPVYEGIAVTNEKTPPNKGKSASLPRKSPRLHSETLCADGSDIIPTIEPKKYKTRRLRIPKVLTKNVNDPRKESNSAVYNVPDKHNQIKPSSSLDEKSPEQTVILTNRYFRNKAKSKLKGEEVDQKSSLPLKEVDNEDVELGMLAIHSDCGETNDNSDKSSHSEDSNCETSLKKFRISEEASQNYEAANANTAKMRRFKSRIATTRELDPRRRVSYGDILTFSVDPIVQIQKLKVSQKVDSTNPLTSSNQTSSNSKIVATLKRRSLETDEDMKCRSKASKVQRVDSLGNYLEDICIEYNQENLEVLSPKNLQIKRVYEDMSTTDYYSSSDEKPSDPNVIELPSQDSLNAYNRADIDIQHEYRNRLPQMRQEAESDLHQQIENVSNKSDLQQLHANEETTIRHRAATTAAAVATNKELMQQQKQIQTNKIYTTFTPYDDAHVKEECKHPHPRSPSLTDIEGIQNEKQSRAGSSHPHKASYQFSNADDEENITVATERSIARLSDYTALHNKLSPDTVKHQINFEEKSVNITSIASPTYAGDCISSPSPVRSGGSGILMAIEYHLGGEIDGRMTYPPIPYILFEVDLSRNAVNKPLDINKLMKTKDPRIFRSETKRTAVTNEPSSSTSHHTFGTSKPTSSASTYNSTFSYDPRHRSQHPELQSPVPSVSPQPSAQNAVMCYNMNATSLAPALPSPIGSSLMHSNVLGVPTTMAFPQPKLQNPIKVLYGYLQVSPWYQSLMSTMKMQISQTISHLLRALNNFHREREINPAAIFDVFKIDCAGEILEIMSNLGLVVDSNGMIVESSQMFSYGGQSGTTMQQHGGTTIHQRGASAMHQHGGGSNAISPVNATYSFIQQVLTKSLATASRTAFNATAGSLDEPFVSCYVESPKPMGGGFGCGGVASCMPKEGYCGPVTCVPKSAGCNIGTTCTLPKGCGCSVTTTCMNHHHHQSPHHHQSHPSQHPQQNNHRHQQDDMASSETSESHRGGNSNNDRQYNQFRKPYQNNNDSSQGGSFNQRYNNNSRYSKPSYSGGDGNSPNRSGSSPSSSTSPTRSSGRGGGRGRGRGGFGRFNKRGGDGGDRQSSSWSSSPPPKGENSYNNRRFNNNNSDNNYNSSYNNSPKKTLSSPPPPQRSPPPLSPIKQSGREGSPVLNSPARQQQQNRPASADEECWD